MKVRLVVNVGSHAGRREQVESKEEENEEREVH